MDKSDQFQLVPPKSQHECKFYWREFHDFVSQFARSAGVPEEKVNRLATAWVRTKYSSVPLAFYSGLFVGVFSYWLLEWSIFLSILSGVVAWILTGVLRTIVCTTSYKEMSTTEFYETVETIAGSIDAEVFQLSGNVIGRLHELYLWRQFPRGLGLVVATLYTAVTLQPTTGALIGVILWLAVSMFQYRLWRLGHFEQLGPKYIFDDRKEFWNFFAFVVYLPAFSTPRWIISTVALAVSLFRNGLNENAVDFSFLFVFFAVSFMIALRNDVV